jgi:DNA-binding transcriptional LysR family regulator
VPEPIAVAALSAGQLVRVLEPFAPMTPGVFLYYPGGRQVMPKLRAFIDHVKQRSGAASKTRARADDKQARPRRRR